MEADPAGAEDREAGSGQLVCTSATRALHLPVLTLTAVSFSPAAAAKSLQSSPTLCDPIDGPTRLLCPWDSPGKNTGVGCHFLLQFMKVKSESEVA